MGLKTVPIIETYLQNYGKIHSLELLKKVTFPKSSKINS